MNDITVYIEEPRKNYIFRDPNIKLNNQYLDIDLIQHSQPPSPLSACPTREEKNI